VPIKFLTRTRELIHHKLTSVITSSSLIDEAMRYSVLSDSKVIRPGLVMASGILNNNLTEDSLITLACSVELIHTYSLIHDDLPSMDDDDMRRGKDSSHVRFGEANAILAGDALHDLAFELIASDEDMNDAAKINAVNILAKASGSKGMVLGQYLDIESEKLNSNLNLDEIEKIHSLKTGRLIQASILMGQLESSLDIKKQEMLSEFGSKIGLAFQIYDDILDETGDSSVLGKSIKSDIKNQKQTYVKVVGLDQSNYIANKLATQSIDILDKMELGDAINNLKSLAEYMVNRKK
jgi:geranylgeranyl pyrophosphate synthase|tara:strand:- start:1051 stop:1932 length:882 start_codon:yes stop_codon:yes gene_type:complete